MSSPDDLANALTALGALADDTDFSGVVRISRPGSPPAELIRGDADRAAGRPNTVGTVFATASATKGLTALVVGSLIESGQLHLDTSVGSLCGDELPLVDPAVTIEHLLDHTSGVGDYLDEELLGDIDDHVLEIPAHLLDCPRAYLPLVDRHPQTSPPGDRFAYNNGGYVILSIAVEAASGSSFYDLVQDRVLDPAGMTSSGFFRSDELPARAAVGYLANGRSNVFHLPVRGAGDGGIYMTIADVEALWVALFGGKILSADLVDQFVAPRSTHSSGTRYGLGFWLRPDHPTVMLEGADAGVSFRSAHDRPSGLTYTIISNTSSGAWPLVGLLDDRFLELAESAT